MMLFPKKKNPQEIKAVLVAHTQPSPQDCQEYKPSLITIWTPDKSNWRIKLANISGEGGTPALCMNQI